MTNIEAIYFLNNATFSEEWQGNDDLTLAMQLAKEALLRELELRSQIEELNREIDELNNRYKCAIVFNSGLLSIVQKRIKIKPKHAIDYGACRGYADCVECKYHDVSEDEFPCKKCVHGVKPSLLYGTEKDYWEANK